MQMFITENGKEDYITGNITAPAITGPKFMNWKGENIMAVSCLIGSINSYTREDFLLYSTAQEVWVAVQELYSKNNTSELYEVESQMQELSKVS